MIVVPIRTVTGLNAREHWAARARRVKKERRITAWALALSRAAVPQIPCTVLLTRVTPRGTADDDNLSGALKAVRDQIAQWIGVDDRDSSKVRYRYAQKRGPWGVEIEFSAMTAQQLETEACAQ